MDVSDLLGTQRWWHSDLCSVPGNAKFVTLMYKHTLSPFQSGHEIINGIFNIQSYT